MFGGYILFGYSEELECYLLSRRELVIKKNFEELNRIEVLAGSLSSDTIAAELIINITSSVRRCVREIYDNPKSTITFVANLRFLFETCITTRLLVAEENYKYKYRYAIYNQQIEKSKSLTAYAGEDLKRLDNLHKTERSIFTSGVNNDDLHNDILRIDQLYNDLDEEISIFLDMAEYNGADYHKTYIHSYLESHKEREDRIKDEWDQVKKQLLVSEEANRLFEFKGQLSKVEKELKDTRSWKNKASVVGLEMMYAFIYDYSSSIIHSTSYSILIPNQLEIPEVNMITGLSTRLTSDIVKNLSIFGKIPNMKVLIVD